MRVSTFACVAAALPATVLAQQVNQTYVDGLAAALKAGGYNQLAAAASKISNTTDGALLFNSISQTGKNYTIFAPNDKSFAGVKPDVSSNLNLLAAIFAYHVVPGSIPNNTFATSPNHTILRSILNDTSYVNLGPGVAQVLVLSKNATTGKPQIMNQNTQVSVVGSSNYQNLLIHQVNAVIDLPPTMTEALSSGADFSSLRTALTTTNLLSTIENAKGITLFAPNNQAFAAAQSLLGTVNASTIGNIIGNHVINGTAIYSPELGSGTHTSAAGQAFTFATNSTGTYVSSGNSSALIVASDMITNNGVIHTINGILLNENADTGAASSAYQSATSSVAGAASTQVGPIGSSVSSPSATSGSGNGGNGNGAMGMAIPAGWALSVGLAALGALAGGAFVL